MKKSMKALGVVMLGFAAIAARAQAPGETTAWRVPDCDHACLTQFAKDYVAAVAKRNASTLKQAKSVHFTENNVELSFGKEGLWLTATGVAPTGLIAADTQAGTVAWLGTAEENGKPVYFALRLGVRDKVLVEAEQIVVRNTGLPLPFADVTKVVHDPTFNDILPPEQRRSRERLRAVADGYFNTVELNDGNIFTPFDIECGRLENGILTTAGNTAGTGGISPGCEAGLKTGAYRINKRIRERRYPVIDVERGVVVATGFFDHANEFDRYKLTDGREQRTALKWPNSISLIEAFRVKDSKIHRIEAVFTYVPHRMHNPFYQYLPGLPAPPEDPATAKERCDKACLTQLAGRFMTALAAQKPADVPWAKEVKFSENGVPIPVGEGIWGSIRSKSDFGLTVADASTGTVAWYGLIYDHDAPAYAGVRLKVKGARISEAEVIVARERNRAPGRIRKQFKLDARLDAPVNGGERTSRKALIEAVEGYTRSMERNDGSVKSKFDAACTRVENGVAVSSGAVGSIGLVKSPGEYAQGCEAQLKLGLYRPLDRIRGHRVLAVDEERGLVVTAGIADFSMAQRQYTLTDGRKVEVQAVHPMARELFEVYKISGGRIQSVDAVSVDQPYGMPSAWARVASNSANTGSIKNMDEQNMNRRQILGGVVATAGAAGLLSQLGAQGAQAAEATPAGAPRIPDQGAAQAPPVKSIKDKVAYITGGSSGIGLGIAQALHEQGAKVVLGNIDDKQFADALKKFAANDPRVATVVHNVMERDTWEAKADEIEKKFGPVDILVNNAGVGVSAGVLNGTYNDWEWLMGVNLWGPIYGCKTFAPRMRARPDSGCHIVTTTSTSGVLVGLPNGIYAVTKIAATGLMEQLRVDLRATNIGTSALIPGVTATNISQSESHRPEALQNAQPYAARTAGQRAPGTSFWDRPQDPVTVGRLVVDGILNNDLFICPAPEYRQGVEARGYAMIESMVPFVATPKNIEDGIAANRYLFTPIYAQEVAHRRATRKRDIKGI